MAEEITVKKDNKKLIYIISGAVVAVIAIVIIIVSIISNKKIDDSYFVSTDTKYVATNEDTSYGAKKRHIVVDYNKEDKITKMEEFIEFGSEKEAKEVYDEMEEYYNQEDMKEYKPNYHLTGKYIARTYEESEYAEMTASEAKQLLELYKSDSSNIEPSEEE